RETPEMNGSAERVIRTIKEMIGSILELPRLNTKYWSLAGVYACHIYNRIHHSALKNQITPYEAYNSIAPNTKPIKVFGCLAYGHIPKSRKGPAFTPRSQPYIFCGIHFDDNETYSYLLFDPNTKRLIRE